MHFGRRLSAFSVAVMAFTLETHDSGLAVTMPPSAPHATCSDCRETAPSTTPPIANSRIIPRNIVLADDNTGFYLLNNSPPQSDNENGSPARGKSGGSANEFSNGWLRMAAGLGYFGGPSDGSGASTPGSGSNSSGDPHGGGNNGGGGGSNGGSSNPPPTDNGGNGGGGTGNGGGGPNGGSSNPPPTDNGGNGGGEPPIIIPDPPPGGYPPPDGPPPDGPPPHNPGGGTTNPPGTTDVPEPASLLIVLTGLAGLAAVRRRKRPD